MTAITGAEIGKEVCKALGLDAKKVKTVTLFISPNEVVITTTEQYVSEEEVKKITEILKVYELHEKKSPNISFTINEDGTGESEIIQDALIERLIRDAKKRKDLPPYELHISANRPIEMDWISHVISTFEDIKDVKRTNIGVNEFQLLLV